MKKIILLFLLTVFITAGFAQDLITNKDIVMMKTSKMSDDIILAKISSSTCDFDLSTSGILELKNAKVPDKIVREMLNASPPKEVMTNDDVTNMHQAKISTPIILAKIDVTEHNFDVSPEGLIKLTTAKVPKNIVKKMMDVPTGKSSSNGVSGSSKKENTSSGKILRFDEIENASLSKTYDGYIAKDGSVFMKGDKIALKFPTKDGRVFQYIYEQKGLSSRTNLSPKYSNTELEIIGALAGKEDLFGSKKFKYARVIAMGEGLVTGVIIEIENAIASGEVKSKVISENEALETIKKAKDKFDLGLITKEEYEKVRKEMRQYIK
ncbi:MAG: hypothetical protein Q4G63_07105 [Bacteroidia bacterium]|nr:hypothetical protein [Bacteroidia bacterium]